MSPTDMRQVIFECLENEFRVVISERIGFVLRDRVEGEANANTHFIDRTTVRVRMVMPIEWTDTSISNGVMLSVRAANAFPLGAAEAARKVVSS